jgi:Divergent InlB B-repeat domain
MTNSSNRTFFKIDSWTLRSAIAPGVAVVAMLMAIAASHAEPQYPIRPRLSVAKLAFFKSHPTVWNAFLSKLPRRPSGLPQATRQPVSPLAGGTWQVVAAVPGGGTPGLCDPQLLTDGTVIVHNCMAPDWWKLTPDSTGSYVNGTWTAIASLPVIKGTQYAPQYNASAVLPDGRVIIMGGEYNGTSGNEVWTSLGAIYDPLADSWSPVSAPSGHGWLNTLGNNHCNGGIGDAASIVLPNGTYLLSAACAFPSVDALFNATALSWTSTGAPTDPCITCGGSTPYQNEQGYTLLPSGKVMTIDVWDPPNAQQYDQATGIWTSIAGTPVSLIDPTSCGNFEIGPTVTRPDGSVVAFGGNTGCAAAGSPADPTAIYTTSSNTWTPGPNVPAIPAANGTNYTLPDAPAVMLPNGNILFAASPGFGNPPTHFFEFTGANAITQVADDVFFASTSAAFYYNFLVLPNGQILATDFSANVEIYTPGGSPNAAWAPAITSVPGCVAPGSSYVLSGTQLNGLTQGAAYGDDVQGATNYPLVRIVNNSSGDVSYARTSGHSTMSIAPGQAGSTNFAVAAATELGASTLYAIANGISSAGTAVTVASSCVSGPALAVTPSTGISASGVHGGTFSPSTFSYKLSATVGSLNYAITNVPSWLTVSSASGTATSSPKTITFKIAAAAKTLTPNTYISSINFNNTSNGAGNTTRNAMLTVNPKQYNITVKASPKADGAVSGGGTFPEGCACSVTATAASGFTFVHWTQGRKVVSSSDTYTFTLSGNVSLAAIFKKVQSAAR